MDDETTISAVTSQVRFRNSYRDGSQHGSTLPAGETSKQTVPTMGGGTTSYFFPGNRPKSVCSRNNPGTIHNTIFSCLQARPEGVSARVLSEHERSVLVETNQLSVHDLVRLLVLQDTVLVAGARIGVGQQRKTRI